MDWLWTWGGISFGFRESDNLWTHDGQHVGRFVADEVFCSSGAYLGEMMGTGRLITSQIKIGLNQAGFVPLGRQIVYTLYVNYSSYAMLAGFEDFPAPNAL